MLITSIPQTERETRSARHSRSSSSAILGGLAPRLRAGRVPSLVTALVAVLVLSIPSFALADADFAACDNLERYTGFGNVTFGLGCQGVSGTLSATTSVYGWEADISTNPQTPLYYKFDGIGGTACVQATSTPGTGLQNVFFATPFEVPAGTSYSQMYLNAYSNAGCTIDSGYTSFYAGGSNPLLMHRVWYTNPGGVTSSDRTRFHEFTSPEMFATTTSPVTFSFIYEIAADNVERGITGYRLTIRNSLTNAFQTYNGVLPDLTVGVHSANTSPIVLTQSGTYNVQAFLTNYEVGLPADDLHVLSPNQLSEGAVFFGVNFNDAIQTVTLGGIDRATYSSASCMISFAGTFDLTDCIGYIVTPSVGSSSPLQAIKNLTLANSFPFSYIYELGDIREALFSATSTASTTVSVTIPWFGGTERQITFLSVGMLSAVSFAGLIRTLLTALLWLMLAELIYVRVMRIHDNHTPV